jgi:hypothetical protein
LEFGEPRSPVNVICQNVGGVLLMAVTVVGGYKNLVPKLFFRRGVYPEFDYFKKFQVFDF